VADFADHGQAGRLTACPLDALEGPFDIIVNATSAGLSDELGMELDGPIAAGALCYDMVYRLDGATAFCRWAAGHGARRSVDGLGMLVEQAALAFELWRGVAPATRPVLELLRPGGV
jgi:shikimate dehydrogenase